MDRHKRLLKFFALSMILILTSLSQAESKSDNNQIAESEAMVLLAGYLQDFGHFSTGFKQQTFSADQRLVQQSEGQLWLSTGGKFRIETSQPFSQILISNGIDLWTVDADLEQVTIRALEKDLKQVPILMFDTPVSELAKEYRIDHFKEEGSDTFVLSPIALDALFEVLSLKFTNGIAAQIEIRDSLSQRSQINFEQQKKLTKISPDVFSYAPNADYDLIDDR